METGLVLNVMERSRIAESLGETEFYTNLLLFILIYLCLPIPSGIRLRSGCTETVSCFFYLYLARLLIFAQRKIVGILSSMNLLHR